ncbi:large conductance mechanosensitive channel protein MscL [Acetobacter orleanensis]|uniref:Large-conductance mechanosensitive channel n=1 Tax=Acetobacter orleanensis TaxID=104099 RepID=A0A4Y3TL92_9PROT|nr:large conductance mechanosensitive channel protein MscL [Acetobacter orleanensis]KXV62075.1 mechanosensitive ion channel protein MscL [Acetobacter orleanensis]PCD80413.1 large conductance mechanosensitive channel protein MscL [Acetobacter orleanensis]GAN67520.1 large-conductance mechanosensitive channel [Acetobacter orleanensis JCM 7639]GBR26334.1 large-conductance mechanosensitive channel [Acetobacter orleanensis NRIC 0473]GEB81767.1 large-conductance mechanosensitive channel [Acetobacter 
MADLKSDIKSHMHTPGWVGEFRAFIMRGNVVDLAVGVIIGAAFTAIVNSLVKDVFNPLLGLVIGGIDFSNLFLTLKGPHLATLAEAQKAGAVTLNIGLFLNAVIQFLIMAMVIFWFVKVLSRLQKQGTPEPEAPPAPTKTEILLEQIRDELAARKV